MKSRRYSYSSPGIVQSVATPTTPISSTTHLGTPARSSDPSDNYSIFPIENEDLIYGNWEDDVIFDADVSSFLVSPQRKQNLCLEFNKSSVANANEIGPQ